jgi:DNA-binding CsgD family transcriptional regulator
MTERNILTPRENQVVELIALGKSQKEVADALGISRATVDVMLKNAKAKLHIQKAAEVSVWYFVNKYGITLNLSPVAKAVISLSFLTLMLVSIVDGLRPERSFRSVRSSVRTSVRAKSGRRSEFDTTDFILNIAI